MAEKKKQTKSKSKKGKTKTYNPSNRKGGEGARAKNRPRDNLFIGDQFGLPDSMYRLKDPSANVNLQPLQNEIAQIRNYMQQQDSRMQLDLPTDLVKTSQLETAINKLSTDLQKKLIPPKPDIVMKAPTKSTGTGPDPMIEKRQALKDKLQQKKQQPNLSEQSLGVLDFKPKKPQTADFIQQADQLQIDLQNARQEIPFSGTDRLRGSRQQKRTQQQKKDQDEGQQRLLIQQRKLEVEEKKLQQTQQQNQLLQEYTKVLQQKAQNPINVNYNVANNTSNFSFQQNTELTRNQYTQKNNYEQNRIVNARFEDLGAFPQMQSQQVGELPPSSVAGFLPAPSNQVVPYQDRSVVEV